ncbi:spore coat protein GerQ, partial [Enterobacter cloacae]
RLNRGKVATIYMTFEASKEWNSKIFRGVIEAAGRDHIIISDNKTGTRYLLLTIYLDYITFDGEIQYDYPYSMSTYSPR